MQKTIRNLGLMTAAVLGARALLPRPEADLTDQVVLITGGSRGLGFLLSQLFAEEGCRIAICARDETELEWALRDLERVGAPVLAVPCDISDQAQVEAFIDEVTNAFGGVDILVNNAGIIQVGPLDSMTIDDFRAAMDIMYWGVVYPTLAVLPQMLWRGQGNIVNITSIGGKVSVPHLLPYCSAKFAAVGFSEGLRSELSGSGVTVTTIVPGLMRTGSHLNAFFKSQYRDEFTWFSMGASLPFISMDAERAARQIIHAMKRGEAERTLSLPANLLARFHGLFPGATADIAGLVNRFILPEPDGAGPAMVPGKIAQAEMESPRREAVRVLTTMGRDAAERLNQ